MGRKKKNKKPDKTLRQGGSALLKNMIVTSDRDPDGEGFKTLTPTQLGNKKLDEIRKSKKSSAEKDVQKHKDLKPYEDYDVAPVAKMLERVMIKVTDGKYGKALDIRNKNLINSLVDAFLNMDQDLKTAIGVDEAITKLLQIGKSFYEYDGRQRAFIDNETYDRILAKYLGMGLVEPTGIVPANAASKVDIQYEKLHNNMDKTYALCSGDPIPEGVKESTRVEDWLQKVYHDLGLSSEVDLCLELSPKIDGVSVNGTVMSNKSNTGLVAPQTRGDESKSMAVIGMDGLDISDLSVESPFGIQYEVFVTSPDAEKASKYLKLDRPYVSNRHAASGIISRLCTGENDGLLKFISLYPIESVGLQGTYEERMDYLQNFGILPDDMIDRKIVKGKFEELLKEIQKYYEKIESKREKLSYAIDGMVITVADDAQQNSVGREGRTNKYQIAYKFDPANAEAVVSGMHLDTGKKGFRTVQIDLDHDIFLDGVRYDHVPILSAGLFDEMGLRVGSTVKVHRIGDAIPAITMVKEGEGKLLKLPKKCPDCDGKMIIKNKKLYCDNTMCRGNIAGRINGFLNGIGIDGHSDAFCDMLVNELNVKSLADLFKVSEDDLNGKEAKRFPEVLRKAVSDAPDYVILGSMGIPDVGVARAKLMFKEVSGYSSHIETCWGRIRDITMLGTWFSTTGIRKALGEAIGAKVSDFAFRNQDLLNREFDALEKHMTTFTKKYEETLKVGHTGGDLSDEVKDICKKMNFDIVDGKSFDVLITSDLESKSGKMETARKKGVPIYTADVFIAQYQ